MTDAAVVRKHLLLLNSRCELGRPRLPTALATAADVGARLAQQLLTIRTRRTRSAVGAMTSTSCRSSRSVSQSMRRTASRTLQTQTLEISSCTALHWRTIAPSELFIRAEQIVFARALLGQRSCNHNCATQSANALHCECCDFRSNELSCSQLRSEINDRAVISP